MHIYLTYMHTYRYTLPSDNVHYMHTYTHYMDTYTHTYTHTMYHTPPCIPGFTVQPVHGHTAAAVPWCTWRHLWPLASFRVKFLSLKYNIIRTRLLRNLSTQRSNRFINFPLIIFGWLLLEFAVQVASKVISEWIPICESEHSCWLNSTAPLGNQVTGTMILYPTQLQYPVTALTSPCFILLLSSIRLGSDEYQFDMSLVWLDQEPESWSSTYEACTLLENWWNWITDWQITDGQSIYDTRQRIARLKFHIDYKYQNSFLFFLNLNGLLSQTGFHFFLLLWLLHFSETNWWNYSFYNLFQSNWNILNLEIYVH